MNKDWCVFLVCIFALCGCSRTVNEDNQGMYEIKFKSNVRESQSMSSQAGFVNNDRVKLYIVEREDAAVVAEPKAGDVNLVLSDGDGGFYFEGEDKHYYPENPIDIYGYCWREEHQEPGNPAAMPVWVSEDQSSEETRMHSDFLYVKSDHGHVGSATPINLEFEHMFAKLQVNIETNSSGLDLTKLSGLELMNVVVDGTFDMGTGELMNGNTVASIMMEPKMTSVVYVLPQSVESGHYLIRCTYDGNVYNGVVREGGDRFEKGKLCRYSFDLDKALEAADKEIAMQFSVKDWDDSEEPREGEFEKEGHVMITLTEVAENVEISKADLFLLSGDDIREVKDVDVTGNKMRFVFPQVSMGETMQLNKAHFYTKDLKEFDYYFTDKVLARNKKYMVEIPSPKVGDAWAGGTVFVVGEVTGYDDAKSSFVTDTEGINAYRGRVVANNSLGKLMWCNDKTVVNATDRSDGNKNMEAVKKYVAENNETLEDFPAFNACVALGEGWYYPALKEIEYIVAYSDVLNVRIGNQGGVLINSSTRYGSSTENNEDHYCTARYNNTKDMAVEVRAVRAY